MPGRRRFLRALAAGLVTVGAPLTLAVPAGAEAQLDRHGWWYKARQQPVSGLLPAPVPAPPTVPEGGLYVANDPSGPIAVAAVRFHAPDAGGGTLTLNVAPGSSPVAELILACATPTQWGAADGGTWESRPEADCDAAGVEGALSDDGMQISWELGEGHKQGDAFDVVLTPAPGLPAPFQTSFEQPTDQSFTPAPSFGSEPGDGFDDGDLGFDDLGGFDPGQAFLDDGFAFDAPPPFDAPGAPAPAPGGAGEVGDGDDPVAAAPPGSAPRGPRTAPVARTTTERIIAVLVIGLIAAGLWRLSGVEAPAPRLIGGLASAGGGAVAARPTRRVEPVVGGVGRFARPRTSLPTRF